jgi:hypothetical protein
MQVGLDHDHDLDLTQSKTGKWIQYKWDDGTGGLKGATPIELN